MKARIKSSGKVVEVVSRFMPKKRNVPSRDWVCNLSDGTCIDENQLEYIDAPEGLEEAADSAAIKAFPEKKSYSTVIDKVVDYNAIDRKNYRDGFIAGAKWQYQKDRGEFAKLKAKEWQDGYDDGYKRGLNARKEK